MISPLMAHQGETIEFLGKTPRAFDASDPGTGKTRAALEAFAARRKSSGKKALVLAPKSILQVAWGDDTDKFIPGLGYICAYATNREAAFDMQQDIYITNHDAVVWLAKNKKDSFWKDFDTLIVDESTAFKHHGSQRSKALKKISKFFEFRENMSGTLNPNGVMDLWHQALILDGGDRLGTSYYRFRDAVQTPTQVGPQPNHLQWKDRDGIEEVVFDLLKDITIRHKFEDCIDIPPNHEYDRLFDLPPKLRKLYKTLLEQELLLLDDGTKLTAINAAAVNTKLLQIASGAVYTDPEHYEILDSTRTELIMDLVDARDYTVVPFLWKHQRAQLVAEAERRGNTYAVIDGSVSSPQKRIDIIRGFQDGCYKSIFIHPQSAGHGVTLTKGIATIFASPTYNAEHYKQVYHRIYRNGQTQKTETINVLARDTIDMEVAARRGKKISSMDLLLQLLAA